MRVKTRNELRTEIALTFIGILIVAAIGLFTNNVFAGNIDFNANRPEKIEKKIKIKNYINLSGPIDTGNKPLEQLKKIHGPGKTYIRINSPGGRVDVSKQIMDEIVRLKKEKRKVICIGDKLVASGAAFIYMTCSQRYAKSDTEILFHGARVFLFMGVVTEHFAKEAAASLQETNEELSHDMVTYAGFTYEQARAITSAAEDTIYSGSYAYTVNFVDKLFEELKFAPKLMTVEELESNSNY